MPTAKTTIRVARVEYQPNLEHAAELVPLGIVVEEIQPTRRRQIWIVGRQPPFPGLELGHTWGPFREIVMGWVDAMYRTATIVMEHTAAGESTLDEIAGQWTWNLHLSKPETRRVAASADMRKLVRQWYAESVGVPVESRTHHPKRPRTAAAAPQPAIEVTRADLVPA